MRLGWRGFPLECFLLQHAAHPLADRCDGELGKAADPVVLHRLHPSRPVARRNGDVFLVAAFRRLGFAGRGHGAFFARRNDRASS